MPACSPPTCPTRSPLARKRLAGDRRAGRVRQAARLRRSRDGRRSRDLSGSRRPSDRGRGWRPRGPARRCRGPPGWRSTSTRCVGNLAAVRDARRPGRPRRARRQGRRLRPRRRPGRARARGGRRRRPRASRRFDEAVELRDAGIRVPILVLYPVPPALAAERRGCGVARDRGRPGAARRALARARDRGRRHGDADLGDPARGRDRARARRRSPRGRAAVAAATPIDAGPRARARRRVDAPPGAGGCRPRRERQVGRFEARAAALVATPASAVPRRHVAASGGLLLERRGRARRRAARASSIYGLVPDELARARRPASRWRRRAAAGPVAPRAPGPRRGPAGRVGGSATARRS